MRRSRRRAIRSVSAVAPAALVLTAPDPVLRSVVDGVGAEALVGLGALGGAFALHWATTMLDESAKTGSGRAPDLLRRSAHRRLPEDLPPPDERRARLAARLDPPAETALPRPPELPGLVVPDRPETQLARILSSVAAHWGVEDPARLTDAQVLELHLFDRLLTGTPEEAGRLAQLFRNPDQALTLRDAIGALARYRSDFDEQLAALEATRNVWAAQAATPRPSALLQALRQLDGADPDLWHKVVTEHDPRDAGQAAAAQWCALRGDCDQATVAIYLAGLAAGGRLGAAARAGDERWLAGVRQVILQWNSGHYRRNEIALDPPEAVREAGKPFAAALERLAALTGRPRWEEPRGVFTDYSGRSPRPRTAWDLKTGRLRRAPDPGDYFDTGQFGVA